MKRRTLILGSGTLALSLLLLKFYKLSPQNYNVSLTLRHNTPLPDGYTLHRIMPLCENTAAIDKLIRKFKFERKLLSFKRNDAYKIVSLEYVFDCKESADEWAASMKKFVDFEKYRSFGIEFINMRDSLDTNT